MLPIPTGLTTIGVDPTRSFTSGPVASFGSEENNSIAAMHPGVRSLQSKLSVRRQVALYRCFRPFVALAASYFSYLPND